MPLLLASQYRARGTRLAVQAARVVFPTEDREEIAAAVADILASGNLTLGPYTRQFEGAFAAAHCMGEPPAARPLHAVAVSSGTAALEVILRSIGVAGRDVVVPANTFFATAEAALRAGGRPVFADIDPMTFALSPQTLFAALTPRTGAVLVVHIGGLITPHVDELRAICAERGIALVEDAAHAHGASYDGRPAGSFGAAAGFSFFPTKVVTSGEGGMILTGSDAIEEAARIYRDQGKGSVGANHHVLHGYAWRMSELAAATGLVHLRRMAGFISHRRDVAARYDAALAGLDGLDPLPEPDGCRSNFYKYIAVLPPGSDRASFRKQLAEQHQVRLAGEVYDLPLHRQPVFSEFAGPALPVAEDLCARHICLPVHSDMTDDEVDQVLTAVAAVYGAMVRV
jgi:dTDP-4-amino-4,6-dideoxygalactose transaminase